MRASLNGDIAQVRAMLAIGVDPNSKTKHGYTALMGAALNGHLDIIKILLDAGADPEVEASGKTPIDLSTTLGFEEITRLLLRKIVENRKKKAVGP